MTTKLAKSGGLDTTRLAAVGTAELKSELAHALTLTAKSLFYFAAIWAELEKRGEDLSTLKRGMGTYIAMIAAGTLLAEAVVLFVGEPQQLNRLAKLPLAEQRTSVASGKLPLELGPARPSPSSNGTHRQRQNNNVAEEANRNRVQAPDQMALAKVAAPRDLADKILEMIRSNPSAREVARRLIPELERVAKGIQTF